MELLELPPELLLCLMSFLGVCDIASLGQTCRDFHRLAADQILWRDTYLAKFSAPSVRPVNWRSAFEANFRWMHNRPRYASAHCDNDTQIACMARVGSSVNCDTFFVGNRNNRAALWTWDRTCGTLQKAAHTFPVEDCTAAQALNGSTFLYTARGGCARGRGQQAMLEAWDVSELTNVRRVWSRAATSGSGGRVIAVGATKDRVWTATSDRAILAYGASTGHLAEEISLKQGCWIEDIVFSERCEQATYSWNDAARTIDTRAYGSIVATYKAPFHVGAVAMDTAEYLVAAASGEDGRVVIWDSRHCKRYWQWDGAEGACPRAIAFLPGKRTLMAGGTVISAGAVPYLLEDAVDVWPQPGELNEAMVERLVTGDGFYAAHTRHSLTVVDYRA